MAEVGVADYALRYGLSEQGVRRAARQGTVPARKVGTAWLIDDSSRMRPQRRRPLSERTATALLAQLDGDLEAARALRPTERARLRERTLRLVNEQDAADLFTAWLRPVLARPAANLFVQPTDLRELRTDDRLVLGGISDARAEISAPDFLEAHVAAADFPQLRREFLLRNSDAPNVRLHVDAERPSSPLPLSALLIDLAADGGPRERARVVELLRGVNA